MAPLQLQDASISMKAGNKEVDLPVVYQPHHSCSSEGLVADSTTEESPVKAAAADLTPADMYLDGAPLEGVKKPCEEQLCAQELAEHELAEHELAEHQLAEHELAAQKVPSEELCVLELIALDMVVEELAVQPPPSAGQDSGDVEAAGAPVTEEDVGDSAAWDVCDRAAARGAHIELPGNSASKEQEEQEADYDGHADMDQDGAHEEQVAADNDLEGLMTVSGGGVEVQSQQDSGVEVKQAVDIQNDMEWEAPAEVDSGVKTECEAELEGEDNSELEGQNGTGRADEDYDVVSMQAVEGGGVVEMAAADEPQEEPQVHGKGEGWGGAGMEGEAGVLTEARSEMVMEARSEAVTRADISPEVPTAADEQYYKFSTVELALISAGLSALAVTGVSLCCDLAARRLAEAATCLAVEHVSSSIKWLIWGDANKKAAARHAAEVYNLQSQWQ
eukprot:jgi/Chrzof1/5314/Cz15g21250.t1